MIRFSSVYPSQPVDQEIEDTSKPSERVEAVEHEYN